MAVAVGEFALFQRRSRTFGFRRAVWLVAGLFALSFGPAIRARAMSFSLGNLPSFYSGKYNGPDRTQMLYDGTTLSAAGARWGVNLTIPYLSVRDLPNSSVYDGGVVVNNGGKPGSHNASGLGDLLLALRGTVLTARGLRPAISPFLDIDIPTASAKQGLGTGLGSYTVGATARENLGWLFPFVRLGYDFVGRNNVYRLRDAVVWGVGVGAFLFEGSGPGLSNYFSLSYSGSSSEVPGYQSVQIVRLDWTHEFPRDGLGFQAFLEKGLTASSPDFGGGLGLTLSFR